MDSGDAGDGDVGGGKVGDDGGGGFSGGVDSGDAGDGKVGDGGGFSGGDAGDGKVGDCGGDCGAFHDSNMPCVLYKWRPAGVLYGGIQYPILATTHHLLLRTPGSLKLVFQQLMCCSSCSSSFYSTGQAALGRGVIVLEHCHGQGQSPHAGGQHAAPGQDGEVATLQVHRCVRIFISFLFKSHLYNFLSLSTELYDYLHLSR